MPESPREPCECSAELAVIRRQLDHLDEMLHEVTGFIAENRPALERATAMLDSGRPMRAFLSARQSKVSNGHAPRSADTARPVTSG